MKLLYTILWFLSLPYILFSQDKHIIEAIKSNEKIIVDGKFNEAIWQNVTSIDGFTQIRPNPGKPSNKDTQVKIVYDDFALYVAVVCLDTPKEMSQVLSQRDDFNANVDNFQLILDTYNDDQNGFAFGVSSKGVQYDAKLYVNKTSEELNMVWYSAVEMVENGWQIEMKIPYSAFRLPKKTIQDWGINFFRYSSINREESSWAPIDPSFENRVAQSGTITNLVGIDPPVRLAFMPYLSTYVDHFPHQSNQKDWTSRFNGGMDVKYGLNEAFTLDVTLVPDFGQVVFDNQVLNLSPFEIQFNENRQFFTEGTELFNKSNLFYSRRIGVQSPKAVLYTNLQNNEYLTNVPGTSQLYNASKLSGRTKKGTGIGVFNAMTAQQSATAVNGLTGEERSILINPVTNYNVLVIDQNLRNNSSVTFTNTNVLREGHFYDANVSGFNAKFNTENNHFYVSTKSTLSIKSQESFRESGYNLGLSAGKQTGTMIYSAGYFEESNTYDPNDLGFNLNNNKRIVDGRISYRIFEPFWKINQFSTNLNFSYNRLYAPNAYTGSYLNLSCFMNSRKFHAAGLNVNNSLTKSYDYFEPRSANRFFVRPTWTNVGGWISSNYQKRFALDAGINYSFIQRNNWQDYSFNISPRLRINDKLFLIYKYENSFIVNGEGYAVAFGTAQNIPEGIIFGQRDRTNWTNTIDIRYTLTNRSGITFRLRHYRTSLSYDNFSLLQEDGTLSPINFDGFDQSGKSVYNTNYNAFTIDFVYKWVFLPGSELSLVWKNSIFSQDASIEANYFNNLENLFDNAAANSLSLKVIYWLDYLNIFKPKV